MSAGWAKDRYTGLFTELGPVPPRPHDPDVSIWGGLLAPCGARSEAIAVGGAGWDRESARLACLGEAIERWQAYPLPVDQVVEASFDAWPRDEPAVEPSRWVLFAADQYDAARIPLSATGGTSRLPMGLLPSVSGRGARLGAGGAGVPPRAARGRPRLRAVPLDRAQLRTPRPGGAAPWRAGGHRARRPDGRLVGPLSAGRVGAGAGPGNARSVDAATPPASEPAVPVLPRRFPL